MFPFTLICPYLFLYKKSYLLSNIIHPSLWQVTKTITVTNDESSVDLFFKAIFPDQGQFLLIYIEVSPYINIIWWFLNGWALYLTYFKEFYLHYISEITQIYIFYPPITEINIKITENFPKLVKYQTVTMRHDIFFLHILLIIKKIMDS